MYYVDSVDAQWRSTLGPSRYEQSGDELRVIPSFTRGMAADLEYREIPADQVSPEEFSGLFEYGSVAWEQFFSTRKVVTRRLESGASVSAVTSNVADALSKMGLQGQSTKSRGKIYELVYLLTDVSLVAKFAIEGTFRAHMRNLAIVDTERAVRRMQEHVRSFDGYRDAVVVAGKYASSWKAARDSLQLFASSVPESSVCVDARFIGDSIFMYGPQGADGWRVFGPQKCASLVRLVHKMVAATSCEAVTFAFGPELTILNLDVHDGNEVLCPVRERHAGSHDDLPLSSGLSVMGALSTRERLALVKACAACEVVALDGENCATAVRITGRYALVNAHVLAEEGEVTLGGCPVVPYRMISSDLWLVKSTGPEVAWHLREPEVGESVYLCYRRHDEMQYLGPVSLVSVGGGMLAVQKVAGMLPGMSGAAVVAASDLAFLGMHDGVTLRRGLAAQFTSEMYTDICSMSEMGESNRESASGAADSAYSRLKARGLGKVVDSVFSSVLPMYSGDVHVGMAFGAGDRLITSCDPDAMPLSPSAAGPPLVFDRAGSMFAAAYPVAGTGPAVTRSPVYGERVVVVGRDSEGEYLSVGESRVTHVGVGASFFQVSGLDFGKALPLTGGLVMALSDAAVVGVVTGAAYDQKRGHVGKCCAYPVVERVASERERSAAVIARAFPFLRPDTWPSDVLTRAMTHPSAGESDLAAVAMIGDSALRTAQWVQLMDAGVRTSEWQAYHQRQQSNAAWASRSQELGLVKALVFGKGYVMLQGSKVHADVLEAVAGLIYLYDTRDAFDKFCEVVGAYGIPAGPRRSSSVQFGFGSSSSGGEPKVVCDDDIVVEDNEEGELSLVSARDEG